MATSVLQAKLEQHLLETHRLTSGELDAMLVTSEHSKQSLEKSLIDQGYLSEDELIEFINTQFNVRVMALNEVRHDNLELLSLFTDELMEEKQVIPVSNQGGRLTVAMVDPGDRTTLNEITFLTGMRPQVVATTSMEFTRWWEKYESQRTIRARGDKRKTQDLLAELKEASNEKDERDGVSSFSLDSIRQKGEAEMNDTENPLVRFVNSLIVQGIEQGASDIHVEPRSGKYIVRFRTDGVLKAVLDIPANMENAVITRLKVMSRMDIADHRRPQDGRITINWKKTDYNIRVNTLPVTEGREKMVMRILRPSKHITDFAKLGFSLADEANIESLYKSPYGIVLVCGPTGSGKSTSLYTVLNKINSEHINVSTVEDPVELKIEGLNQSQVNPKSDFTFASSMRALLRQDPDVIMVGEIRDYETLEAGIHAALTGHLVFSTIHANSAATTITRMLEMGASASLISAALNGVIAQRLVRSLCVSCKEPHSATELEKQKLFPKNPERLSEGVVLYKAKGCPMCKQSGYSGRTGLYEIMMINRELRHLISAQVNDLEIEDAAIEAGMTTLTMCARSKILEGVTDFAEIERVLGILPTE
jgi:type IV pilus assembly protein PilB